MSDVKSFDLLRDYAPLDEVARDLGVCVRTLRRRINQPDGWPYLLWGGRVMLHIPTVRERIAAEVKVKNPTRRKARSHREGRDARAATA